jgi:peptidoglycan-N-acetylglucosamine deacetylase
MIDRLITTWDDYSVHNERLAALLKKYDLYATFFVELIPQYHDGTEQDAKNQIKSLHDQGFDIGSHSMTHPRDMKLLNDAKLKYEIFESKLLLEELLQITITDFCYPRGRYDLRAIEFLKKSGYTYARTTEIKDDIVSGDPFRAPTSVHVFQRKEYDGKHWLEYAKKKWDKGGMFHLWGHAWEIDRDNQWDALENFFKYITN